MVYLLETTEMIKDRGFDISTSKISKYLVEFLSVAKHLASYIFFASFETATKTFDIIRNFSAASL